MSISMWRHCFPVAFHCISITESCYMSAVRFAESEKNDSRHCGEENATSDTTPPHGKKPPTAHPLTTYADLNLWFYHFFILHTCCKVPFVLLFKCIYANGALWDVLVSTKTFVLHRICQRHRNRFINWADMQIRPDELQILWDKVSSTAGFWGRLSGEGSCCCYHGGPSPSFRVCPAINDALWFSCSRPPILVFARLYVFM